MARELKQLQNAMSIDEQIDNLKKLGLSIEDETKAKSILNNISYYRLIKAYSTTLKQKNSKYNAGTSFEDIVYLYSFNTAFRQALLPIIERIEITARCRISNYVCKEYGVLGYKNKLNYDTEEHYNEIINEISREINRNNMMPFVRNFKNNYQDGDLPMYAVAELCTFGTLSKLFKSMVASAKKEIAASFNVGYTYLESWLEAICYVRNVCAHYGRFYNAKLIKRPIIYKQYVESGIDNGYVFAILLCMKHLLKNEDQWTRFVGKLKELINSHSKANIAYMGFPKDWENQLLCE